MKSANIQGFDLGRCTSDKMALHYKIQGVHILGVTAIVCLLLIFVHMGNQTDIIATSQRNLANSRDMYSDSVEVYNSTKLTVSNRNTDDVDWIGLFSFVPNGIRTCQDLFQNKKYLVEPFRLDFEEFVEETKKYSNLEGYSALRIEQYISYVKIAESPFVKTVCETGFNAGHSTLAWLAVNPRTHVYSFDLGVHDYARPMMEFLQRKFPGRLNVTWGDSTLTLPEFHRKNPNIKCDLLIVDGGHTNPVCQSDFDVFRKMANKNNLVILDNYPDTRLNWMEDLGNVWERAKRKGHLNEIFSCSFLPSDPHGFSVGRYNV